LNGFKVFDRLRGEKPDFMNTIKIIEGDLENSSMSLSSTDRDWMLENVNFVFHCAATVKFNEPLDLATKINIQGTENLLTLATEMKNLKVTLFNNIVNMSCYTKAIILNLSKIIIKFCKTKNKQNSYYYCLPKRFLETEIVIFSRPSFE